eukprot:s4540_g3.t1
MVRQGPSQYKLKLYRHLIHEQFLFIIWVALPQCKEVTIDDIRCQHMFAATAFPTSLPASSSTVGGSPASSAAPKQSCGRKKGPQAVVRRRQRLGVGPHVAEDFQTIKSWWALDVKLSNLNSKTKNVASTLQVGSMLVGPRSLGVILFSSLFHGTMALADAFFPIRRHTAALLSLDPSRNG